MYGTEYDLTAPSVTGYIYTCIKYESAYFRLQLQARPQNSKSISFRWKGLVLCDLVRVNCWHFGSLTADKVIASVRLYPQLGGQAGELRGRDVDQ